MPPILPSALSLAILVADNIIPSNDRWGAWFPQVCGAARAGVGQFNLCNEHAWVSEPLS